MVRYRLILSGLLWIAGLASAHPGQHDQLARINHLIEQQPDTQSLYIQRGIIYSSGGQFEQARADYTLAQQLGPPVIVAYELGILYYRMGDYDVASDYLDRYLKQFPSSAAAYDYRARVAREAGDYTRAVSNLEMYFRLSDSPHPGHYLSAAELLQKLGETDRAIATLDRGMDKLGLTPQLQHQAIRLELQRQQPEKALSRLEALRLPLKESPSWKLEMAELLLQLDRQQEADELLLEVEASLNTLRPTPARLEMRQRARDLQQ